MMFCFFQLEYSIRDGHYVLELRLWRFRSDRNDDVGEAHQCRFDSPAVIAGEGADDDADRGGDDAGEHHDHERLLSTAHDDREDVAAHLILAERVVAERDAGAAEEHGDEAERRRAGVPKTGRESWRGWA